MTRRSYPIPVHEKYAGPFGAMTTYDATRRRAAALKGTEPASMRSIWMRRGRSVFTSLYIPAKCNPGQFVRAPRTVRS